MKKTYTDPKAQVLGFVSEDIITASPFSLVLNNDPDAALGEFDIGSIFSMN